jgi:dihydrofolate reductase
MKVSIIVAVGKDNLIGVDGKLPWSLPVDMARFRSLTCGCPVIMGRKTWESLPKKPLEGRLNVVLSREAIPEMDGVLHFEELLPTLDLLNRQGHEEVFIIGGSMLYSASWPYVDRVYLTRVNDDIPELDGEQKTYLSLPDFNTGHWIFRRQEPYEDHKFVIYDRNWAKRHLNS